MRAKDGSPKLNSEGEPMARSAHSLNPVPFIIYDPEYDGEYTLRDDLPEAGLANIAATAISLMGYHPPEGFEPSMVKMSGSSS